MKVRGENPDQDHLSCNKGLFQSPTVLNNVETLANIPYIILYGAENFASVELKRVREPKYLLLPEILNTGLIEVPIGITLGEIVYNIGVGIPEIKI